MKDIKLYIDESLSQTDMRDIDSRLNILKKSYGFDIDKPFFIMVRIPKKKEFHIYPCKDRAQLEEYYERSVKEPLVFGRFGHIRQTKEELLKITKYQTFTKEHYKVIEEN